MTEKPLNPAKDNPVDINPRDWLTHNDKLVVDYVETRAGKLKVAALSERESEMIRNASEKPSKTNPRQKEANLKLLRLNTVAYSLNKAAGVLGTAGAITPEDIEREEKLAGEISLIVKKVSDISGYHEDEGDSASDASPFLQIS